MPRPGAGRDGSEGRIAGGQGAALSVELVNEQFVQAQIGNEAKMVGGIRHDAVRIAGGLPFGIHAAAGVLFIGDGSCESAIGSNGKDCDVSMQNWWRARIFRCDRD